MARGGNKNKKPDSKGMWIGDYYLSEPMTNKGAGFSVWGIGEKDGVRYFLKEYLTPVYPDEAAGLSEKTMRRKVERCTRFEQDKYKLFRILDLSSDGNLLRVEEFFRYGTKYYLAAEAIESEKLPPPSELTGEQIIVILLALSHAVMCFHKNGLVHGDIKPDNILYRRSRAGFLSPVVIDVDSCYYKADPPKSGDDLVVDQMFMSPETFRFIRGESVQLDEKIDVFALGLIFYQILTGTLPGRGPDGPVYPFSVLLEGGRLDTGLVEDGNLRHLINRMLMLEPSERPSMEEVHEFLMRTFGRVSVREEVQEDPETVPGTAAGTGAYGNQQETRKEQGDNLWHTAGML
ncbi:MAG: protein kinase [Lachnospiraceae bacterium]|nr:protein kinase [Lachnospiraceae bacterium]